MRAFRVALALEAAIAARSAAHLACRRLMAQSVPDTLTATAQAIYGTVGVGAATGVLTLTSGWLYARLGPAAFGTLPVTRSLRLAPMKSIPRIEIARLCLRADYVTAPLVIGSEHKEPSCQGPVFAPVAGGIEETPNA